MRCQDVEITGGWLLKEDGGGRVEVASLERGDKELVPKGTGIGIRDLGGSWCICTKERDLVQSRAQSRDSDTFKETGREVEGSVPGHDVPPGARK